MRLSNYRHEGPHNRTLALLTERDVQDALGDRMPPDDGGAEYPRWEAAIVAVTVTPEGEALVRSYLCDLAHDLANLVAEQVAPQPSEE